MKVSKTGDLDHFSPDTILYFDYFSRTYTAGRQSEFSELYKVFVQRAI